MGQIGGKYMNKSDVHKIDWTKIPVNTKVLVREDENADWLPRHFAGYSNGYYCTYPDGCTSWTNEKGSATVIRWNQCKLAEECKNPITIEELSDLFEVFCDKYWKCEWCVYDSCYTKSDCRLKWLLDNYNVVEK